MPLQATQIIGNEYSNSGNATFKAYNPGLATEMEPAFTDATDKEIVAAAMQADQDFDAIRNIGPDQRATFLNAIANEIEALGDALIIRASQETGLPEARIQGERGRTVGQLRLFAKVVKDGSYQGVRIDTADPNRTPVPKPDIRMVKMPLGPVAIFGSSNFPLAFSVAGGDTASALAAGCPVIVKAHPGHPGTSQLVGEAIKKAAKKANMPAGTFSLLHGKSNEVGGKLVKHPLIKAVAFTGSFRGGKALFDQAARREEPIPCFAEMGSINPVYFLPKRLEDAAETLAGQYVASVNLGVGQFCTNPGVAFAIKGKALDKFIDAAAKKIEETQPGVMLHPGIKNGFKSSVGKVSGIDGVTVVVAGQPGDGCTAQARLLITSALTFIKNPGLQEEMFGPASLLVVCENKGEMLGATRVLKGNLTATLQATASELKDYQPLISLLERKVGRLVFNGFPTGVEVCHAMVHGGPYPATTDSRFTSVGTSAIDRFLRPVCYQDFPEGQLPPALQNGNDRNTWRMVNGEWGKGNV